MENNLETTLIDVLKTHINATWITNNAMEWDNRHVKAFTELVFEDEMIEMLLKKGNPFSTSFMQTIIELIRDNIYVLEIELDDQVKTLELLYEATINKDLAHTLSDLVEWGDLQIDEQRFDEEDVRYYKSVDIAA